MRTVEDLPRLAPIAAPRRVILAGREDKYTS
jgi:hypothetical protein